MFVAPGREMSVMSSGQRFMTDLLVSSLMADGGLETSLNLAVKAEIKELEEKKVRWLVAGLSFHGDFVDFREKLIKSRFRETRIR